MKTMVLLNYKIPLNTVSQLMMPGYISSVHVIKVIPQKKKVSNDFS